MFTSSAAVTLQPYMGRATFALVINQSESKVLPPATDAGFLVPGYPASKLRAEELVLAANGTPLADGSGMLKKRISFMLMTYAKKRLHVSIR